MKIPKNSVEISFFIFLVLIGYYYDGFIGMLIGGFVAIISIIRGKMMKKVKW